MSLVNRNLFVPNKMAYAKGKARPNVGCILCAIIEGDPKVERLEVHESKGFMVCLNLYPYSPGHLMLFPKRHLSDVRQLTKIEIWELHKIQSLSLQVLDEIYAPHGYNIGYNIGSAAGASIEHLHLHIVPRYIREIGFIDVIGGAKIIVEDPNVTRQKLMETFKKMSLTSQL